MFLDEDLVKCFLRQETQRKGIYILGEDAKNQQFILYHQVLKKSLCLSKRLESLGAEKGTEIIIQCRRPENFIYCFWACLLHNFIAVPVDASHSLYSEKMKNNFLSKLENPIILTDISNDAGNGEKVLFLEEDIFESCDRYQLQDVETDLDEIVYIQFSSGSTAIPRGVVMRKSNIYADALGMAQRQHLKKDDIFLTWQPLTHCYGLIVFHIIPIMLGMDQYIIPTEQFMRTPMLWLEAANRIKATRLGTIPFALKHFIDAYKNSKPDYNWNLSSVKSILIGAEQISKTLCDDFVELMKLYDINKNVMMPLYGLAETVTIASLQELQQPLRQHRILRDGLDIGKNVEFISDMEDERGVEFLEIGKPVSTAQIAIMDADKKIIGESMIGHICVKGEIVTTGYYKDEENTKNILSKDGWLDTGDVGFLKEGKLTVVGRFKELIVINGKKFSCTDIESIITAQIDKKSYGQAVACSIFHDNLERTIIFVERKNTKEDIQWKTDFNLTANRIRKMVYQVFDITIEKVLLVDEIPRTFSGKIKRVELMREYVKGKYIPICEVFENRSLNNNTQSSDEVESQVQKILTDILEKNFKVKVSDIYTPFYEYGIISVNIPYFIKEINAAMGLQLKETIFFNYPNIKMLSDYIGQSLSDKKKDGFLMETKTEKSKSEKIAIVGMSCRFPGGANSVSEFWDVLINGKDGICDVPEKRWKLDKYYSEDENASGKMYCKKGGFLNVPIDEFDASFFNISPKEAIALDPQQRLVLELVWEAFENAQIPIKRYENSDAGVFLGISTDEYALAHIYSGELSRVDAYSLTGMCKSTACGRVSYTFGFEGPCVAVDTACSSTLTAMHFACNAIKEGETSLAVVAGINLIVSPATNIGFSKLRATSKDGHSKSFDESANGYGRGEGGGVLILKKLSDAVRDEDNILGVVCATAVNQDGKSNGLTAPNGLSQKRLIEQALQKADLSFNDIDYIEMHGTGTKLGDPIEVNAILNTYCKDRGKENSLRIGSVKSNIGHLEAGAGIASIMKVLLSMRHEMIPSNLHFQNPNKMVEWSNAPIQVVAQHSQWKRNDNLRRAGINGFGFGGSNAHVIVEEYVPEEKESKKTKGIDYILKISAKSEKSLQEEIQKYYECIHSASDDILLDILNAANRKRTDFDYRFTVEGSSREEIIARMEKYLNNDFALGVRKNTEEKPLRKEKKVVFMFTGQGSQYVDMGKTLFQTNQVFQDAMLECERLFEQHGLESLIKLIYSEDADEHVIARTLYAQPLIFMMEYALAKMWESLGVKPQAVIGHSIGEYAAAVIAGSMTLQDAVKLVSVRGRLMDSAPGEGTMATIFASEKVIEDLIREYKESVSIAALNGKETCVISGHASDVRKIIEKAQESGIRTKELQVSHGFHSVLMSTILKDFDDVVKTVEMKKPLLPFISSLYAREIQEGDIFDHNYWTNHIAQKVDFYHAVTSLGAPEDYIFLEIGSNTVLSAICKMIFGSEAAIAGSLSMRVNDAKQLAECISILYTNGVSVNWDKVVFTGKASGVWVELPNYAFDRNRFWQEPLYDRSGTIEVDANQYHPLLGQRIKSPLMGNAVVMQRIFTAKNPYFMSEHIIFDAAISPAAAHISMLLSAEKNLKNPKSVCIKEMEFRNPLAVHEDEERTVQVCIFDNKAKVSNFSIVSQSCEEDNAEWITHTQGRVESSSQYFNSELAFQLEQMQTVPFEEDTDEILYGSMHATGFDLGEGFRRVTKNYNDNGKGFCVIEPLKTIPGLENYELYPGVIDSLLQTMLCTQYKNQKQKGIAQNEKTIIPYFIGKITYNYRNSDKLWCCVNINNEGDILYGEVTAFNEQGEAVIEIKDFMAKFTTKDVLLRNQENQAKRYSYFTDWEKENLLNAQLDTSDQCQYVIVSDQMDNIEEIKKYISRYSCMDTVSHILLGEQSELVNVTEELAANAESGRLKFIFYPYYAEMREVTHAVTLGQRHLQYLLKLIAALDKSSIKHKCRLKLITYDTQSVEVGDGTNLADSIIWGFSKVLSLEYASLYDGIIDIKNSMYAEDLWNEIRQESSNEVCLRNNQRYVGRLTGYTEHVQKTGKPANGITVQQNGSYVITGGNGAVGLTYAESLAEMGAKSIILLSRREPLEDAKKRIQGIKKTGVEVTILTGDVTHLESLRQAIAQIPDKLLPVHGVIHAAGTLKDNMISEITWEEIQYVMKPKVAGAIHLSAVMELEKMDFFLLISSITSVIGNMGQSNYAAANYFMNQFALYLNAKNIPAYSVSWGPWSGGGMAVDALVTTNLSSMGMTKIEVSNGKELVKAFFAEPYCNVMVADVNWMDLNESIGNKGKTNFLSKLLKPNEKKAKEEESGLDYMKQLNGMSAVEKEASILNEMTKKCCMIMGFENTELFDVDKAFREQGADSLMLFSIRTALNKLLHIELDISILYNYSTLRTLTKYLIRTELSGSLQENNKIEEDMKENTDMLLEELEQLIN